MGTATFNTKNPSLEVELTVSATLNDRADVARYTQKFSLARYLFTFYIIQLSNSGLLFSYGQPSPLLLSSFLSVTVNFDL